MLQRSENWLLGHVSVHGEEERKSGFVVGSQTGIIIVRQENRKRQS